ncbi:MAG: hypothetical protein IJU86_02955 [Firmicutes bacterium]|nr:hypothetical protein [Bacillota bacterium]
MNNIKIINSLLCLIFSFVFLFSNVFSIEAAVPLQINEYEDTVLEEILDPDSPDEQIVACKFTYITVDYGEGEVIWIIGDIDAWIKEESSGFIDYSCARASYEISQDGSSAEIFVTIGAYEYIDGDPIPRRYYHLTFELNLD